MTTTTIFLRTIGIFFRIYVSNRIGAEGMGLYQMIVSVYVLVSSFASSGLTTAVTKLCTDELAVSNERQARRILRTATGIGIIIGSLSVVIVCMSAEWLAGNLIHDSRATLSLFALSASLPFMGISCCIKGYFLAKRKVTASSFSQILEQLVRIGVIAILLSFKAFQGVTMSCLAVMIGDTVAEAISCLYIVIVYFISNKRSTLQNVEAVSSQRPLRSILAIAAPITAGRYINSGLRTIENTAVPFNVALFCHSKEAALAEFGKLKGMAMPLLFFPSGFLSAVSALLIPEVSEANALGQKRQLRRTVSGSISITLFSSYLIGAIFIVIADPLSRLIYKDASVGYYIYSLGSLTPVMYLESVVVGLLKGLNQQTHSLIYSIADSAVRIILIYAILPSYGMPGMILLMVVSNLLTCSLNLHRLLKVTGCRFRFRQWLLCPLCAAGSGMIVADRMLASQPAVAWSTFTQCVVGVVSVSMLYIPLLFMFRCVRTEEFRTVLKRKRPMISA